jgi:hypothetical protein
MKEFINKHPWMTFFIILGGIGVVDTIIMASAVKAQLNAALPTGQPSGVPTVTSVSSMGAPFNVGAAGSSSPQGYQALAISTSDGQAYVYSFPVPNVADVSSSILGQPVTAAQSIVQGAGGYYQTGPSKVFG